MEVAVLEKPALELAIGLRTYLEITGISAPPEAEEGDWVYVGVQVTNNHTADIYVTVTGTFDGIDTYPLGGAAAWVSPGEYMWWPLHFTMPDRSVSGTVRAYYLGTDEAWHLDDTATVNIALKVPVGWQPLDSAILTVSRAVPPVVGWTPLASRTIGIASVAPPVVGWQPLGTPVTVNIAAGLLPPEYELIQHTIYPLAYFYDGPVEVGATTFSLPIGPPPIVDWIGDRIANAFADKIEEQESRMLELKVYRRTQAPWVNYRLEATAAVTAEEGVAIWPILAALPWRLIITAAIIAAIAYGVVHFVILPVARGLFHHKPGLEAAKKIWESETLITTIIDVSPEYSREDLEGKSEEELRDICDKVHEEVVPPAGWPWYVWLGITGVGIAGSLVAVTALRTFAPKKK